MIFNTRIEDLFKLDDTTFDSIMRVEDLHVFKCRLAILYFGLIEPINAINIIKHNTLSYSVNLSIDYFSKNKIFTHDQIDQIKQKMTQLTYKFSQKLMQLKDSPTSISSKQSTQSKFVIPSSPVILSDEIKGFIHLTLHKNMIGIKQYIDESIKNEITTLCLNVDNKLKKLYQQVDVLNHCLTGHSKLITNLRYELDEVKELVTTKLNEKKTSHEESNSLDYDTHHSYNGLDLMLNAIYASK
jgi:hypothetical protein